MAMEGDFSELPEEGSLDFGKYRVEVVSLPGEGPVVESRELLQRLYGEPQGRRKDLNPYLAKYRRLTARLLPRFRSGRDNRRIAGNVDYRYWPSLKLGYIENVYVSPEARRVGLGVKLISFAVSYMRRRGSQHIYAFGINPEGCGLLVRARFVNEPPQNPAKPWRRWFTYGADQTG